MFVLTFWVCLVLETGHECRIMAHGEYATQKVCEDLAKSFHRAFGAAIKETGQRGQTKHICAFDEIGEET